MAFHPVLPSTSKRRVSSLDIGRPSERIASVVSLRTFPHEKRRDGERDSKRTLDGVHREKKLFLRELQERSFQDTLLFFFRRGEIYFRRFRRIFMRLVPSFSPHKLLYGSLMSGVAFGMVSMAFLENFLGSDVSARSSDAQEENSVVVTSTNESEPLPSYNFDSDIFFEYFTEAEKELYEERVREMVKGYPIEHMLPYIFEQEQVVAAFLIGIGKKESNWGKRVPVLEGQDCFNYWGYRGVRRLMGTGGHTCFNSRKDAVETVAKRLKTLIYSEKLDTPEKMIIWKCGFSCEGHSRESVKKWISDVDMYFREIHDE